MCHSGVKTANLHRACVLVEVPYSCGPSGRLIETCASLVRMGSMHRLIRVRQRRVRPLEPRARKLPRVSEEMLVRARGTLRGGRHVTRDCKGTRTWAGAAGIAAANAGCALAACNAIGQGGPGNDPSLCSRRDVQAYGHAAWLLPQHDPQLSEVCWDRTPGHAWTRKVTCPLTFTHADTSEGPLRGTNTGGSHREALGDTVCPPRIVSVSAPSTAWSDSQEPRASRRDAQWHLR